jgi:hypothetical protein
LAAPNASALALLMYLRWFLGMAVKLLKLPLHPVQKTALAVSAAKPLVPLTF